MEAVEMMDLMKSLGLADTESFDSTVYVPRIVETLSPMVTKE